MEAPPRGVDDVTACLREDFEIADDRLYVTGVSAGAFFALFLAKVRPDVVAAAAAFSGTMRRGPAAGGERPPLVVHYGGEDDVTPA